MTLGKMKAIIATAEENMKYNSSLSDTIEIEITKKSDTHCGNDSVKLHQKNNYAECGSLFIGR